MSRRATLVKTISFSGKVPAPGINSTMPVYSCLRKRSVYILLLLLVASGACKKSNLVEKMNGSPDALQQKPLALQLLGAPAPSFKVLSFNIRHDDPTDPQTIEQRKTCDRSSSITHRTCLASRSSRIIPSGTGSLPRWTALGITYIGWYHR